ncbi:hypothetical protein [Acinetobacter baumannii]|uniref:hypothetical protein n=1 Tax=Acinetobacter baumannii TaxID=470 RepID=UPI0024C2C609|nr:hypothetical protein [Acinetobacter baumannii]MDK1622333.1 hypothetical protein [Acinetobacter baumannii]
MTGNERIPFESQFKTTEIFKRESAIRENNILAFSETMNSYFNIVTNDAWQLWNKAKAQAVPEGFKIVPIELSEEIAERLALERVQKPRPENDPVWVEIAERAYKSNLLAKKWELVQEYKILTEASESGAEG